MNTIEPTEVEDAGGNTAIWVGVSFEDPDSPEYTHSVVWKFESTFVTDSQTPFLEIRRVIHKKYWQEIEAEVTTPTTDDGSEIIVSEGWTSGPFDPAQLPASVSEKLQEIFGEQLVENTVENASTILDSELTEVSLCQIPDSHTVIIPDFTLHIKGRYTEMVEPSHERVTEDGSFTKQLRDGETKEVLDEYHPITHHVAWWFVPSNSGGLTIGKCIHKIWDDGMVGGFETKYENEEIVEAHTSANDCPSVVELPDSVLRSLAELFGETVVVRLLEGTDAEVPKYVYECVECGEASEVTPRSSCPHCGSESVIRYDSIEAYQEAIEDESEKEANIKKQVARMGVSFTEE